ncbi:hypothetical protein ACFE04_029230 [Oxalis oulophora]
MTKAISMMLISVVISSLLITQSEALYCTEVGTRLSPCFNYIINGGSTVPAPCCESAKTVLNIAMMNANLQTNCNCLKSIVSSLSGMKAANVVQIPTGCGFQSPFTNTMNNECTL